MKGASRRAWLRRLAAGGLILAMERLRAALAQDTVKQGVVRVRGDVFVSGRRARPGVAVAPGDVIATGRDAELVFVVERDAFLARGDTRLELSGRLAVQALRIVTGALLSVYPPGASKTIRTPTASIGIRGTGLYVEIEPARTYACTCYGEAELVPLDDPRQAETVRTTRHDQPRYIYPRGVPRLIEKAPVKNHTDAELILLESLVGRTVPFDPGGY
jgi:hypothetical protein